MTPGSSKKDTDLVVISRKKLDRLYNLILDFTTVDDDIKIADRIVNSARPFTEELVWMTPEEEEKRIRQAAINGVLDRAIEKFGEWYDAGFARPVTKEHVTKILETLRQQQAEGSGGQG